MTDSSFENWLASLEKRHLADLTFSEVSRALRALSSTYVERRAGIAHGAALSGAGKRAAFALFYAPLHFLLVRTIVSALATATSESSTLVDLGCGTGAAGAAWAQHDPSVRRVVGVDVNSWAIAEAARTYRHFGLRARTIRSDLDRFVLPRDRLALVAAFTLNELRDASRDSLLTRLLERARQGDRILIVEPLAGFVSPWWNRWRDRVVDAGGRADEWRFDASLPPLVVRLDRAAGLNHEELTGRSLWCGSMPIRAAASGSSS